MRSGTVVLSLVGVHVIERRGVQTRALAQFCCVRRSVERRPPEDGALRHPRRLTRMHTTEPHRMRPSVPAGDPPERLDVVVVGAGQAGLAIGHHLARSGRRFAILEAGPSVGTAWRERWDSLVLFTPRRYDALPGLAFPGEPDGYPGRDEVIAYLERYAQAFDLPIVFDSAVRSLKARDGAFVLDLDDRRIEADQVVVPTGPFHRPHVPALAGQLAPEVFQAHSAAYRRPAEVPAGNVLVVGGGDTRV